MLPFDQCIKSLAWVDSITAKIKSAMATLEAQVQHVSLQYVAFSVGVWRLAMFGIASCNKRERVGKREWLNELRGYTICSRASR
jgi:hypothetical protein